MVWKLVEYLQASKLNVKLEDFKHMQLKMTEKDDTDVNAQLERVHFLWKNSVFLALSAGPFNSLQSIVHK